MKYDHFRFPDGVNAACLNTVLIFLVYRYLHMYLQLLSNTEYVTGVLHIVNVDIKH